MERDYELIDVCHPIEDGMITYKGLPAPIISDHLTREASRALYAPGTEFHIGKIEMVANTGTYLDSPFHRYSDGTDLADSTCISCKSGGSGGAMRERFRAWHFGKRAQGL